MGLKVIEYSPAKDPEGRLAGRAVLATDDGFEISDVPIFRNKDGTLGVGNVTREFVPKDAPSEKRRVTVVRIPRSMHGDVLQGVENLTEGK